jgi:DNA modification methylase
MVRYSALVDTQVISCGDNLDQLRKMPDKSVDLIYIDPPFNSSRNYEVFWEEAHEKRSFEDRHASTKAYIEYMHPRCVELARVLKKSGSFYYHCDWHASHYVKVMLDQILGENNFKNEIIWKRADAHNDAKGQLPVLSDSILFYTASNKYWFNIQHVPFPEQTLRDWYLYLELPDGSTRRMTKEEIRTQEIPPGTRRFNTDNLRSPNPRPNLTYDYKGYKPHKNGWSISPTKMADLDSKGLLLFPKERSGRIMKKKYLDESSGPVLGNVWTDISQLRGSDSERLGYPTQKPLRLLERILKMSSQENDVVLDAFCGCGTALEAAFRLNRQWIGIDISPTACRVIAKRLRKAGLPQSEALQKIGRGFVLRDLPWTPERLRKLPPFEFENWAVIAIGGLPNSSKVGDMGIDGRVFPVTSIPQGRNNGDKLPFMDEWFPVQVKQREKVGRPEIDSFEAVMAREERDLGFFVAFDYTSDAEREVRRFHQKTGREIRLLRVDELIDIDHERQTGKKPVRSVGAADYPRISQLDLGLTSRTKSR